MVSTRRTGAGITLQGNVIAFTDEAAGSRQSHPYVGAGVIASAMNRVSARSMTRIWPRRFHLSSKPAELSGRIVLGAAVADPVRLHGAIAAALELLGASTARHVIFAAALDDAAAHSPAARDVVAAAIRCHLAAAA